MNRKVYRNPRCQAGRRLLDSIKASGCIICGETDPDVLDFHHVDPLIKSFNLAGAAVCKDEATLNTELAKTVVLCANDHRRVEAGTVEIPTRKEQGRVDYQSKNGVRFTRGYALYPDWDAIHAGAAHRARDSERAPGGLNG